MSDLSTSDVIIDQSDLNSTNSTSNFIDHGFHLSYGTMQMLFLAIAIITVLICFTICITACICICLKRYVYIFMNYFITQSIDLFENHMNELFEYHIDYLFLKLVQIYVVYLHKMKDHELV